MCWPRMKSSRTDQPVSTESASTTRSMLPERARLSRTIVPCVRAKLPCSVASQK
ncbi:MAG TPA: hypothetical protein VL742_13680 [Casimicrobiaceae bacterium]|nr:hypothetical protein [Casimicrobiaceae bacterium]